MKLRVALVFLVLFIASVFVVFYIKDYFFIQTNVDQVRKQSLTAHDVVSAINDKSIELYDYQEKTLNREMIYKLTHETEVTKVFHFWASWCDPCAQELPELIDYAAKNVSKVQIYLVSLDGDAEGVRKFSKVFPEILSQKFIQVWDKNNELARRYGVDKLPMSIFVFSDGRIEIRDGVVSWKTLSL